MNHGRARPSSSGPTTFLKSPSKQAPPPFSSGATGPAQVGVVNRARDDVIVDYLRPALRVIRGCPNAGAIVFRVALSLRSSVD